MVPHCSCCSLCVSHQVHNWPTDRAPAPAPEAGQSGSSDDSFPQRLSRKRFPFAAAAAAGSDSIRSVGYDRQTVYGPDPWKEGGGSCQNMSLGTALLFNSACHQEIFNRKDHRKYCFASMTVHQPKGFIKGHHESSDCPNNHACISHGCWDNGYTSWSNHWISNGYKAHLFNHHDCSASRWPTQKWYHWER